MLRAITPQSMPEAFLAFQPQKLSMRDLYGEKKPIYDFIAFSQVATDAQRQHFTQFELVIQKLQAWAKSNFTEEEAKKFLATLDKFHARYKRGGIGDLTVQEYGKYKEKLEEFYLLLQNGPKPPAAKQVIFRNFIQQLGNCPDGMYTSQPHFNAMLADTDCYEAWLARKRYDILERAKNNFMQEVYDPNGILGGMDIHVLNAFIIRAAELGYAPSVDMSDVRRDKYVPGILREFQDIIDDFIKMYLDREYTLETITNTVEKGFIDSVFRTREEYLKEYQKKHKFTGTLGWEWWKGLARQLTIKFEPLANVDGVFNPTQMLGPANEADLNTVSLVAREEFQKRIKPILANRIFRKLLRNQTIPLSDGNGLFLNNTAESSFIVTKDERSIPFHEYVFQDKDRDLYSATTEIFKLEKEKAKLAGEIKGQQTQIKKQRGPLFNPIGLPLHLNYFAYLLYPQLLFEGTPKQIAVRLVTLPLLVALSQIVLTINISILYINLGHRIYRGIKSLINPRLNEQLQEGLQQNQLRMQDLNQDLQDKVQSFRKTAAERQKAAKLEGEAAESPLRVPTESLAATIPDAKVEETSGRLVEAETPTPSITSDPVTPTLEEVRTPRGALTQNSMFAEKARTLLPAASASSRAATDELVTARSEPAA